MRIDLPLCSFKDCRHNFDGNCKDKGRKEKCEFDVYKKAVEEQPKIGGWIPCSEQLPKKNGRYLCTMKSEEVMECYYGWNAFHTSKMFFRRYAGADVIAWKPLPEAYHE